MERDRIPSVNKLATERNKINANESSLRMNDPLITSGVNKRGLNPPNTDNNNGSNTTNNQFRTTPSGHLILRVSSNSLKGQPGNVDLVVPLLPHQLTKSSLQPDEDRLPRVDILWKTRDKPTPPGSNYPLQEVNSTGSKFALEFHNQVPQFLPPRPSKTSWRDVEGAVSLNNNLAPVTVELKERPDNGTVGLGGHQGGHERAHKPPKDRRPTLTWPWHHGNYRRSIHFADPAFRTQFSIKLLFLKIIQWCLILAWTLGAAQFPVFKINAADQIWTIYISVFMYTVTFLTIRSSNLVESTFPSCLVLIIYTVSLSHIIGTIYFHTRTLIIPLTLMTLIMTYLSVALISLAYEMDASEGVVFYPAALSALVFSIVAFSGLMSIANVPQDEVADNVGVIWVPTMILTQIITMVDLAEIQSVITGGLTPLGPHDWDIASAFLL